MPEPPPVVAALGGVPTKRHHLIVDLPSFDLENRIMRRLPPVLPLLAAWGCALVRAQTPDSTLTFTTHDDSTWIHFTQGAYTTDGTFDLAKWERRMDQYNTTPIRDAIEAGVADGTVLANSLIDEPENKKWGRERRAVSPGTAEIGGRLRLRPLRWRRDTDPGPSGPGPIGCVSRPMRWTSPDRRRWSSRPAVRAARSAAASWSRRRRRWPPP